MLLSFALGFGALCGCLPTLVISARREYYIAAVIKEWNYAPSGQNKIKGIPLFDDR